MVHQLLRCLQRLHVEPFLHVVEVSGRFWQYSPLVDRVSFLGLTMRPRSWLRLRRIQFNHAFIDKFRLLQGECGFTALSGTSHLVLHRLGKHTGGSTTTFGTPSREAS